MSTIKTSLHPNNKHRGLYDFNLLIKTCPELAGFVKPNQYKNPSIDFFDPAAVKALNKALLKQYYNIQYWDIPVNYLCPPIPGRAEYIHRIAEFIHQPVPNTKIKCLDIGVGANCIYPIIGTFEYGWNFVGSDIDPIALESANNIIQQNTGLKDKIELRLQKNTENIFAGIIQKNETFDITICNPPFHASAQEAQKGTERKLRNLKQEKNPKKILNFGGQSNELWCNGGELNFIKKMILESAEVKNNVKWFSVLVSKESNVLPIMKTLDLTKVHMTNTITMNMGNKSSRIILWTFNN